MKSSPTMLEVTRRVVVTEDMVKAILVGALETPIGSWFSVIGSGAMPAGITYDDFRPKNEERGREAGKFQDPSTYYHPYQIIPVVGGCSLRLMVDAWLPGKPVHEWEWPASTEQGARMNAKDDVVRLVLNRAKLLSGIKIMAEKYPRHFNDWMDGNDDANTSDLFLQCCLFGEEVFA